MGDRVIIAGSRCFQDAGLLESVMEELYPASAGVDYILSGNAIGADRLGEQWAERHHRRVSQYRAQWDTYGKSAGFIRNELMAQNADVLIAFWDGKSKGTRHMINLALKHGLEVHVYQFKE